MASKAYFDASGARLPSVTTVIGRFKDSGNLLYWANKVGREGLTLDEARKPAADAGTIAHGWVEDHINKRPLREVSGDPDVISRGRAAYDAYLTWQTMTKLEIRHTEVSLSSNTHRFGGTLDAIGMVAGKAYRLGLPLRGHNGILLSLAAKKGSPKPAAEGTLHGYAEPSECVHSPARVKLVDLLPSSCRWPLGDPKTREFGFCGRNRADGLPYCADHAKVAYQPQQITNRTHGPAREKVSANVTARPKVTV